jgi:hypothetical protein
MKHLLFSLILVFTFVGCSARPLPHSGRIADARAPVEIPSIPQRSVITPESDIDIGIIESHNHMAGRPSFGIIKGFYQLPEAFPHGAVSIERMRSFGFDYASIKVSKLSTRPYVVTPASAMETQAMSQTINALLDARVKFVEVPLADAVKIMEAERAAMKQNVLMFPHTAVPSGVDLLVSIEKGYGSYGPIYVGRVIRTKDGRLCALATVSDFGPRSLGSLVSQLVKDSLRRVSDKT